MQKHLRTIHINLMHIWKTTDFLNKLAIRFDDGGDSGGASGINELTAEDRTSKIYAKAAQILNKIKETNQSLTDEDLLGTPTIANSNNNTNNYHMLAPPTPSSTASSMSENISAITNIVTSPQLNTKCDKYNDGMMLEPAQQPQIPPTNDYNNVYTNSYNMTSYQQHHQSHLPHHHQHQQQQQQQQHHHQHHHQHHNQHQQPLHHGQNLPRKRKLSANEQNNNCNEYNSCYNDAGGGGLGSDTSRLTAPKKVKKHQNNLLISEEIITSSPILPTYNVLSNEVGNGVPNIESPSCYSNCSENSNGMTSGGSVGNGSNNRMMMPSTVLLDKFQQTLESLEEVVENKKLLCWEQVSSAEDDNRDSIEDDFYDNYMIL